MTGRVSEFGNLAERIEHMSDEGADTERRLVPGGQHIQAYIDRAWMPALLVAWERRRGATWQGRVGYACGDAVAERLIPAELLRPLPPA